LIEIAEDTRSLIDIVQDFKLGSAEFREMEQSLSYLLGAMNESKSQLISLSESTASLQRMTTTFNQAKRRLVSNLSGHVEDMSLAAGVLGNALDEIGRMTD
jgi:methyl-accepting chemotaxis protein